MHRQQQRIGHLVEFLRCRALLRPGGGQVQVRYYIWPSVSFAFSVAGGGITKEIKRKEPVQLTDDYEKIEQDLELVKWPKDEPDPRNVRIRIQVQELDKTGQPINGPLPLSCLIPIVKG